MRKPPPLLYLIPVAGCCLFILLYITAAVLYPGGSNIDKTTTGFSILHNYWCDLLGPVGKNGEPNAGWRFAMSGMVVLSISLIVFWILVPALFPPARAYRYLITGAGVVSMLIAPFLYTAWHDVVINVASVFGITALLTTFVALFHNRHYKLFAMGLVCLLMVAINNIVYYTGDGLYYLPVLQKVTFLLVMSWMGIINLLVYQLKTAHNHSGSYYE